MSVDHWLPDQTATRRRVRRPPGRPRCSSIPVEKIGGEQIDYGYLLVAHTAGDIYVYFKDSNVLAVGDVASPVNDPELDWITGAWIGGASARWTRC
jgi:glyoxylase-like metal-dependent hydrolase (beta-lactamase superfamily II)